MAAASDDDVLDAVTRLLDREGLRGLSLSAIAAEAGLSRVTLHRRGGSVEAYVIAVVGRASNDLREALWPALIAPGPAAERLREALGRLCEVAERHTGVLTAVYDVPVHPLPDDPGRTTSLGFVEPFERLLGDGVLDASLVSEDPGADAALLANAVTWTYLHMRQAHGWSPAVTAERVIHLAMAAHLPPA